MQPINLALIDPGVRAVVARLRLAGFETTDSGDGYSKPAGPDVLDFPHVAAVVRDRSELFGEAVRMARLLGDPWRVEATFSPNDGSSVLIASAPPMAAAVESKRVAIVPVGIAAAVASCGSCVFFKTQFSRCDNHSAPAWHASSVDPVADGCKRWAPAPGALEALGAEVAERTGIDTAVLESRALEVGDVARVFGVPAKLLDRNAEAERARLELDAALEGAGVAGPVS